MARKKTDITNIAYDDIKKKYYVTLNYGYNDMGVQIKKTKTASTKTEAKQILRRFEADKIHGNLVIPRTDTLAEWLNYWMESVVMVNREKTTYAGYKFIIEKHITPKIGSIQLQKLTPQIIQRFYTEELNEVNDKGKPLLSSNTVRKHHTLLKTALNFAVHQDVLRTNPIDKVTPPKYIKPKISFYTVDSLKNLFNLVENDYVLKPTVYLAGYLGLRREEICGLRWKNICFENKIILIKEVRAMANTEIVTKGTKNSSSTRKLSFGEELELKLLEIKAEHKTNKKLFSSNNIDNLDNINIEKDYVVTNELGKPIHPGYLSTLFGKFVKANNLPHITLHGLRHTIASVGNDAGLTLYDISKILGHSSPDVTGKIYTHLFDETQRNSISKIQDKLK